MNKTLLKSQVKHLARLTKLELSKKELEKYSKDLSGILDYVSEISKLNLKNIQPTSGAVGLGNIMRQDKIKKLDFNNKNAGQYFKTKTIFS
ncbi:MAG: Asp-tRNA(Asn)/Glu-tRNA(Gln) amidotransferase subunit GatC [bacterium]